MYFRAMSDKEQSPYHGDAKDDGRRRTRLDTQLNEEEEYIIRRKRKRGTAAQTAIYRESDDRVDGMATQLGNSYSKSKRDYTNDQEDYSRQTGPRKVEMQYLARSRKVKRYRFDNIASASRKTGVSAELLQGVCDDGGGFLGGSWFSFYISGDEVPKKPKEFFQPHKFDVSKLKPLPGHPRTGRWWKKLIELVCRKTETTLVAFPSTQYAAAALGLRTQQVRRACNSYGTGQQYDFDSYMLRFSKNVPSAYVYGSFYQDFQNVSESHERRMTRWSELMTRVDFDIDSTVGHTSEDALKGLIGEKAKNDLSRERPQSPRERLLKETLTFFSESFEELPDLAFNEETRRLCIFCQQVPSEITFEPCGHSMICQTCANQTCHHFCPRCRLPIFRRTRGTLKPLAFSSNLFMD